MRKVLLFFRVFFGVYSEATSIGFFAKLVELMDSADVDDDLKGKGPFTLFIPTEEAFKELNSYAPHYLKELQKPENKQTLRRILTYHIIDGEYPMSRLKEGEALRTVEGSAVRIRKVNGKTMVNDAEILSQDAKLTLFEAKGGMIHEINHVLIPPPQD